MKIQRLLLVVAIVSTVAFIVGRTSTAQTTGATDNKTIPRQFSQLILTLDQRGDTNMANEISSLMTRTYEEQKATDVAITVRILESLRSGNTKTAIKLLETGLDGALITFSVPSSNPRDTEYDKILETAKKYRAQYPYSSGIPDIDNGVNRTFSLLSK
jgi:hypothetical protein